MKKKKDVVEYYTFAYRTPNAPYLEGRIKYDANIRETQDLLREIEKQLSSKEYTLIRIVNSKGFTIWGMPNPIPLESKEEVET